jgi:hypothetical protein
MPSLQTNLLGHIPFVLSVTCFLYDYFLLGDIYGGVFSNYLYYFQAPYYIVCITFFEELREPKGRQQHYLSGFLAIASFIYFGAVAANAYHIDIETNPNYYIICMVVYPFLVAISWAVYGPVYYAFCRRNPSSNLHLSPLQNNKH